MRRFVQHAAGLLAGALLPWLAACEVQAGGPQPVNVFVDGEQVLTIESVDAPLDVFAALGLEPSAVRYAEIRATDPIETPIRTTEPAEQYPKRILAAFPADSSIGVGYVDRVLGEMPTTLQGPPPVSFAAASEVRLRTVDVERAPKKEKLPLAVTVGDVELLYDAAELNTLEFMGPQLQLGLRGGRQRQAGTPVTSLVLDALRKSERDLADVTAVVIRSQDGEIRLGPDDLTDARTYAACVKRNRKGLWRLKVWTRDGDEVVDQDGLRDLTGFAVELAK